VFVSRIDDVARLHGQGLTGRQIAQELGITPPTASWGNIIHDGQAYLQRAWWIATFPGLAILLVAVALHLISDGVRETLDPSKRS